MPNQKSVADLFNSPKFKKTILFLGGIFYLLTIYFTFNPQIFLKFGLSGIFVFSLFGPVTILVPTLSRYLSTPWIAFVGALGMALNDSVGWLVGKSGDVIFPRSKKVLKIERSIHKYGPLGIFFWALIPVPFDFIAMIAGYLEIPYKYFVAPTFIARFIRFIILGAGSVALFGKVL